MPSSSIEVMRPPITLPGPVQSMSGISNGFDWKGWLSQVLSRANTPSAYPLPQSFVTSVRRRAPRRAYPR